MEVDAEVCVCVCVCALIHICTGLVSSEDTLSLFATRDFGGSLVTFSGAANVSSSTRCRSLIVTGKSGAGRGEAGQDEVGQGQGAARKSGAG